MAEHKQGTSFATKDRGPWKLIYYEAYADRQDAEGGNAISKRRRAPILMSATEALLREVSSKTSENRSGGRAT